MGINFPNISPNLIDFGFIVIRWYALAYIGGILLGWWYAKKLIAKYSEFLNKGLEPKFIDDYVTYAVLGIILGGRAGYVLFYNLPYYIDNPLEAFKVWEGGMSFHGGLIGVMLASLIFVIKYKINFFAFLDIQACVAPIGLFFGRLANFINDELWGRVSNVPWAVKFPSGGYVPRHPSQLYEAALEGLILFIILMILVRFSKVRIKTGLLSASFGLFYGTFRCLTEKYREPDIQLGFLWQGLTMGQILSFTMILLSIIILSVSVLKKTKT